MKILELELDSDGVALVRIDMPARGVNVFAPQLVNELAQMVAQVRSRDDIRGLVITSGKPGSFIAGADLTDLITAHERGVTAQTARDMAREASTVLRALETCGKPVAAAINGMALGGGLELCLACHYRVLADLPGAVVGLPEVSAGLLPSAGGTQRLPRLIGIERALPLLLEGGHLAPVQALRLGLVDAVLPTDQLVGAARRWVLDNPDARQPWDVKGYRVPGGAGALAGHASASFGNGVARVRMRTQDNYPAQMAILSCVYEGTQLPLDLALRVEANYFGGLLAGPVARNLMRTMFVNKRAADQLVRRPPGVPRQTISKLGVLGAGMMGAGIAYAAASAGMDVVLLDTSSEAAAKGKAIAAALLETAVAKGIATAAAAEALLARIVPGTDFEALAACDLVVEAVFESREVKADVMRRAEQVLPESAVFASNTSTLPISGLARHSRRPERVIGIHFFSPVQRMPLVEIIVGQATSAATLAAALDFVGQLRKTPIVVNDSPGFYTSRIFCAYIDEGMAMLQEGVAPALIENAARQAGMASGPLAVADEVSLDLQKRVVDQASADALPARFLRSHAHGVIQAFNELGRLGRKTGGGFYDYPAGAKKRLWPGLARMYRPLSGQPPVADVKHRLLYIQALEAARSVEEGVVAAADADLGAVLGLGFPSWTGGTLSLIDSVGPASFVAECDRLCGLYGERFRPSAWLRERAGRGELFHATTVPEESMP